MTTLPPRRDALSWSERVYRRLLLAYPRAFREEYAAEMLLVFRDAYREVATQQRRWDVLRLWRFVLSDFIATVTSQWVRKWVSRGEREVALAGKEQLTMALQFSLDVAQHTDIGRIRPSNEDNLVAVVPSEHELLAERGALFVVADGLGGHSRGEIASDLAVQRVKAWYYQHREDDIPTTLQAAVMDANAAIYQMIEAERNDGDSDFTMGATCVAAVLHQQMLYVANVGDSRAYVLHAGQLRQITRDHSVTAQMVERGELTPVEARTHEQRNIIYRSLGRASVEVDLFTESVQAGDTLILCTDGLCGVVEDDELRAIVTQEAPAQSVPHLIARANDAGGPDNVTVIVVRVTA